MGLNVVLTILASVLLALGFFIGRWMLSQRRRGGESNDRVVAGGDKANAEWDTEALGTLTS